MQHNQKNMRYILTYQKSSERGFHRHLSLIKNFSTIAMAKAAKMENLAIFAPHQKQKIACENGDDTTMFSILRITQATDKLVENQRRICFINSPCN
jgi:hypothetical protein